MCDRWMQHDNICNFTPYFFKGNFTGVFFFFSPAFWLHFASFLKKAVLPQSAFSSTFQGWSPGVNVKIFCIFLFLLSELATCSPGVAT